MYNATLFISLVTILNEGKRSMPIYEYLCEACGHQQESLQKISDKPLTDCEACQQPTLKKLISAAGNASHKVLQGFQGILVRARLKSVIKLPQSWVKLRRAAPTAHALGGSIATNVTDV